MTKLRVLDLFSGIGGFSLGLERTGGFETVAFCEIEDYPRRVLAKHWPGVPIYDDVRTLTADTLRRDGIGVDVICGGFPCQDLSLAGNLAGIDGERSGLWSEIARLAGELRPSFIIVENVANLLSGPTEQPGGWFGRVLGDLAALGYDAEWHCIPASAIGAPHRRDRVWLVAYPGEVRCDAGRSKQSLSRAWQSGETLLADASGERCGKARELRSNEPSQWISCGVSTVSDPDRPRLAGRGRPGKPASSPICDWGTALAQSQRRSCSQWAFEPELGRVADGISNRVDRVAALGNAVVPQIPEMIGHAILRSGAAE